MLNKEELALAERQFEIASARLQVAEFYRSFMGLLAGVFAWKILEWNGWVSFAVGCVAFFFADYSFSKEYDKAHAELDRLWKAPSKE